MVAVCQDMLLKGFTAVLSEQPLLALGLADRCKSLRDICRPHLIFENLSKLLLECWAVPDVKWSTRYFSLAKSYERALAVFQQHTLNLIPCCLVHSGFGYPSTQCVGKVTFSKCTVSKRQGPQLFYCNYPLPIG